VEVGGSDVSRVTEIRRLADHRSIDPGTSVSLSGRIAPASFSHTACEHLDENFSGCHLAHKVEVQKRLFLFLDKKDTFLIVIL
jgi:hypothetical protein